MFLYVCLCLHICVQVPAQARRGSQGYRCLWANRCRCWEPKSGLQEQQILFFPTELSLQPKYSLYYVEALTTKEEKYQKNDVCALRVEFVEVQVCLAPTVLSAQNLHMSPRLVLTLILFRERLQLVHLGPDKQGPVVLSKLLFLLPGFVPSALQIMLLFLFWLLCMNEFGWLVALMLTLG